MTPVFELFVFVALVRAAFVAPRDKRSFFLISHPLIPLFVWCLITCLPFISPRHVPAVVYISCLSLRGKSDGRSHGAACRVARDGLVRANDLGVPAP